MSKRGETLTEDNVVQQTNVTFEFNIKRSENTFDVRAATTNLLAEIFKIDRSLKVKSKTDGTTWGPSEELPVEREFHTHFATKYINPKYSNNKALVHTTMITKEDVRRLKFRPSIFHYIKDNNIWIKEDLFGTQISSTPGYFIHLHPRATCKETMKKRIIEKLQMIKVDKEEFSVNKWIETNIKKEGKKHCSYTKF